MNTELEQQAIDLSVSTTYSHDSICRLQSGLRSRDPQLDGSSLSESEILQAVPELLKIDMVLGGNIGVGRAMRLLKESVRDEK